MFRQPNFISNEYTYDKHMALMPLYNIAFADSEMQAKLSQSIKF